MSGRAYFGSRVFDGQRLIEGKAVLVVDGVFQGIVGADDVPEGVVRSTLDGGVLLPGFVDLQVNGGGGVMFNDDPTPQCLAQIAEAHATTGTRAILPTLITDTPAKTMAAVEAVEAAMSDGIPGIIGIHLEGPHLSIARKGAHDPALIRAMTDDDEAFLIKVAARIPNVMVTVAPENVSNAQINRLSKASIVVSLGHSDCGFETAMAAFGAGARCVTHLFNAMSQMGNREPGLVGATLQAGDTYAGLIADNIHVHAATMRAALAAKASAGRVFLVSDSMATVGSDIQAFDLNGRVVRRHDGRLTLEDGTLAGADLTLPVAVSVLTDKVGVPLELALAMATSIPAALIPDPMGHGKFEVGQRWTGIYLDANGKYVDLDAHA